MLLVLAYPGSSVAQWPSISSMQRPLAPAAPVMPASPVLPTASALPTATALPTAPALTMPTTTQPLPASPSSTTPTTTAASNLNQTTGPALGISGATRGNQVGQLAIHTPSANGTAGWSASLVSQRSPESKPLSSFRLPPVQPVAKARPQRMPSTQPDLASPVPAAATNGSSPATTGAPVRFNPWHPPALLPDWPYEGLLESRRRQTAPESTIQPVAFNQAQKVSGLEISSAAYESPEDIQALYSSITPFDPRVNRPAEPQASNQSGLQPTSPGISLAGFEPIESVPPPLVDKSLCPSLGFPHSHDFSPTPLPVPPDHHDPHAAAQVYDNKYPVPVQRPLIEWGRQYYGSGITPPSETWLGKTNLVQQQFYVYGDYRTGFGSGRNAATSFTNWASRLNLDIDYRITSTERFHAFLGPLNRANQFTRLERDNGRIEYQQFYNLNPVTAFFEGDMGALIGGFRGVQSQAELPVTAGLVPLLFQNGVWMEDAVTGIAFGIPARHSRKLKWSNYDATFFAVFDQINSPAFGNDNNDGQAFGTAWFIDAYDGYIESGYAYVNDRENLGRSYHNMTTSYTRRYFHLISNSVRVIVNAGQDLAKQDRTADGVLLLFENSLVSETPMNVIPYFNLFSGWGRPQSVARAGVSGGILRNTGINFEIDGLNGYPTLDDSGSDTFGGSLGVDLIGKQFDRQWIVEASYLTPHGDQALINGDQCALGTRYQQALSHCTIIRFDTMYGWRKGDRDLQGVRVEYRWKF